MACMRSESLVIPPGSFFVFTYQSPRLVLSLSLRPNQPSSRTNSSTPTSFAAFASSRILLSEKLKYVASQLLHSTGRSLNFHAPRTMWLLMKACMLPAAPSFPNGE